MDEENEAALLFWLENPSVDPEFARVIVLFNWGRGVRDLEDLTCVEQFANAYADVA